MKTAILVGGAIVILLGSYGVYVAVTPALCLRGPVQRSLPQDFLPVGGTLRLRAGTLDILGECDNGPPRRVHFASTDTTVVRVDRDGLLRAIHAGAAQIEVRAGLARATHSVRVGPTTSR